MDSVKKWEETNETPKNVHSKNITKYKEAIKLYLTGANNKEISKQTGISEQTMSIWIKEIKKDFLIIDKNIKLLHKRINELIINNAPTKEIKNTIKALERYILIRNNIY